MKLVFLALLGVVVAFSAHLYIKFDLANAPDVPEGGFTLLVGGLKGIVVGVDDVRPEREYRSGYYSDLPDWYKGAWSFCYEPAETEPLRDHDFGAGARLEVICYIEVDGERIPAGSVISVPNI